MTFTFSEPLDQLLNQLTRLMQGEQGAASLTDTVLLDLLQLTNTLYRGGEPLISDAEYDGILLAELQRRNPDHPYLHQVEAEPPLGESKTVELPQRMLSTEKAYAVADLERWLDRVRKGALELGLEAEHLTIRLTPKLDGFAAYDDGERLYTRGDGWRGSDISRVLERGLLIGGDGVRGQGAGEIVVNRRYFEEELADQFDNSRNFQAAVLAAKREDEQVQQAIRAGAVLFMPFAQLPEWRLPLGQLLTQFEALLKPIWESVEFDVDGVVLEVVEAALRQQLGSTRHHHRWQIAFKINQQRAEVVVTAVVPQTSRSGRINPVAEFEPTRLSGATLSRATAHHYAMVNNLGIGVGAVIELVRSGLVIPKIERVIQPAVAELPSHCPSCQTALIWEGDHLRCLNTLHCPAQIAHTLEHFFRTLGNVDGFGGKTIERLYQHGIRQIQAIYALTAAELVAMGFGEKVAANLLEQLQRSRREPLADWRFLAAFGVVRLGGGNSERLLQQVPLAAIFELTVTEMATIEGFAETTATAIVSGLAAIRHEFEAVQALGFNLQPTPLQPQGEAQAELPLAGQVLVFTGTMVSGSRDELAAEAKALGAKVGSSVTGKTTYLITGEQVGATKIEAARAKGVAVLTEAEYRQWLQGGS